MSGKHQRNTSSDPTLEAALAGLIACTRSKRRPLSLPEVAALLATAVSELGSVKAVAERIGLSTKMLRQFSSVDALMPRVRQLFAERVLDSVDLAVHLAMLSPSDQDVVASQVAEKRFNTADVRAVVQLRKASPRESISSLVQKVAASKTERRYVVEFVVRGNPTESHLVNLFRQHFSKDAVIGVALDGPLGRLTLTREGRDQLRQIAKGRSSSASDAIAEILSGAGAS